MSSSYTRIERSIVGEVLGWMKGIKKENRVAQPGVVVISRGDRMILIVMVG